MRIKDRKQLNREYYLKNKEHVLEKTREWQKNNVEKFKIILKKGMRKYRKTPKGIYRELKQNSKKKKRVLLSQEEFIRWYNRQKQVCVYCGIKPNGIRLTIDRMNNNKGYVKNNLALACSDCNSLKSNILTFDEMKIVGKIIMKKRWKKFV